MGSGLSRRLRAGAHGLTDELLTRVIGGPKLYPDGFGSLDELQTIIAQVRDYDAQRPPPAIELSWDGPRRRARGRGWVRRGRFQSPGADVLPEESRVAHVEYYEPQDTDGGRVCLLLAATGEEGYTLRRRLVSELLRNGIGSLLLENPYYGTRRPRGQKLSLLRTVRDQFAMNTATVDEARALLRWLRGRGHAPGASGYSQGGMMASFAAALSDFPVAAIPRASGRRAAPIFTENALLRRFAWDALAESFGGREPARRFFAESLQPVDVGRFPAPRCPRAAILVGSVHDRYIRPQEVEELHAHWPGSELRWLETGHLTGALLGQRAHARAIVDAFARLD